MSNNQQNIREVSVICDKPRVEMPAILYHSKTNRDMKQRLIFSFLGKKSGCLQTRVASWGRRGVGKEVSIYLAFTMFQVV